MLKLDMSVRATLLFCLTLVSAGCAHVTKPEEGRNANLITAEEIETVKAANAYELISKLRGNFLRSRGQNSLLLKQPKEPTVFLDTVEYGTIASLRNIPVSNVAEIRFIEGWDATTKYGAKYVSGVIQINTRLQ